MGLRFRKSFKAGPFRITASKSGVSTSFGGKGARITKTASGKTRTTISIPGTGLSYVSETGKKRKPKFQNYSPEYLAAVEMVQAEKEQEAWMAANKRKLRKKPKPPKEQELSISAVKRTGILFVIVGIPLSLLFLPVGLAVLAYGVYQIIKAPTVLEKMKALQASEVEKYQVALAEWEAQQEDVIATSPPHEARTFDYHDLSDYQRFNRFKRACLGNITDVPGTTLHGCSCGDFTKFGQPCSHMYALALDCGEYDADFSGHDELKASLLSVSKSAARKLGEVIYGGWVSEWKETAILKRYVNPLSKAGLVVVDGERMRLSDEVVRNLPFVYYFITREIGR